MASSGVLPYSQGRPPATFPGRIGGFGGGTRPVKPGAPTGHYAPPTLAQSSLPNNGIYSYGGGGVTAPPQQYNPGARTIAGSFVGGAANNGAAWAQHLQNSPWAGHGPNTAAGWQQAGYGNPAQHPTAPPPPHNSATTQTPAAPDPRDSTYYANVGANQFKVNNQQNAIGEQGGYAAVDLQNALAKLAYQQPRDELKAEQAANNRGGLYSSVYNQQLGDLAHAYQDNNFSAQQSFDRGEAARAAQSKALEESVPLYNAQQYAAATIRGANAASQDKSLGESGKPLIPGGNHPAHGGTGGHQSNTQRLAHLIASHGPAHPEPVRPGHVPAAVRRGVPNVFGSRNTRGGHPGGGKPTRGVHQLSSAQRTY